MPSEGRTALAADSPELIPSTANIIVRDSTVSIACRVICLLATLGSGVITARVLGAAGRGILAIPTIDATIASSSFAGFVTAQSFFLLNRGAGRGATRAALLVAIPFVIVAILTIILLGILGHHPWAILYAAAYIPLIAIASIATGLCVGTKRVRLSNYIAVIYTLVSLLATVAGFAFLGRTPYVAIKAWLFAYLVIAVFGIYLIVRFNRELPAGDVPLREAFNFAARCGTVNFITLLNYRADLYVVAAFGTAATLGVYTLAVTAAEAALTISLAVTAATAPHIGSLPLAKTQALTARTARNNIALSTISCLSIALVTPLLAPLLFGPTFSPLCSALDILLLGIVALSAGTVFSNYFTLALGKPEIPLYSAGASAFICITMSVWLVPRIGINGAALATTFSYITATAIQVALFRRSSGLPLRNSVLLTSTDIRAYRELAVRVLARTQTWRKTKIT